MDIARLGLAVDSSQVQQANDNLGRFSGTAAKAEQAAARLTSTAARASEAQGRLTKETNAAASAADKYAGATGRLSKAAEGTVAVYARVASAIGAIAGAMVVGALTQYADKWSDINARLRLAVGGAEAGVVVMQRLSEMARRTYSDLGLTAESFIGNAGALKELGYSTNEALDYTESLNLALVVSGARADRAASVTEALSRAMALGKLSGDQLNTVIMTGGRVAELLAEKLGVGQNQLRSLGAAGKITGDIIASALTGNMEKLREEAESMPATIGDAFTLLRNSILMYVGSLDEATGVSAAVADAIIRVGDNLDRIAVYAGTAATAFGTYLVGAFVAANIATITLSGSLAFLRTALIRTGIGAAVVMAGELAYQFTQLVEKTGGWSAAVDVLKVRVVLGFDAIKFGFFAATEAMQSKWYSVMADIARGAQATMGPILRLMGISDESAQATISQYKRSSKNFADLSKTSAEIAVEQAKAAFAPIKGMEAGGPTADLDRKQKAAAVASEEANKAAKKAAKAYADLISGAESRIASLQAEKDALGLTTSAAETLRMKTDLLNEAQEKGLKLSTAQQSAIGALAKEYGDLSAALERAKLNQDLMFEAEQMNRSPLEADIAGRLRGTGISSNSPEANMMRNMDRVDDQREGLTNFLSAFKEGALEGGDDIGKSIARRIADSFKDEAGKLLDNVIQTVVRSLIPAPTSAPGFTSTANGFANLMLGGANDNAASSAITAAGPTSVNARSMSGGVAQQAFSFFKGKGLSDYAAAAMVGQAHAESGFNPSAIGDGGLAHGLFQHHPNRGGNQGLIASGAQGQLEHAWKELQTTERGVLTRLQGATNARDATRAAIGFERPQGWSAANPEAGHNFTGRLSATEQALSKFGGASDKASQAVDAMATGAVDAGKGLGQLGNSLSGAFPAAPTSSGGGGIGGFLGKLLGVGGVGAMGDGTRFGNSNFGAASALSSSAANFLQAGGKAFTFSDGGYTGDGGVYDPAGTVHKGEVVWSQRDIAGAGGVSNVERMRKSGGRAGGGSSSMTYAPVSHISIGANAGVTKADVEAIVQNNNKDQAAAFEKKQANAWRFNQ